MIWPRYWAKAGLWSCCFWEPLLLILSICDKFFKPKNQSNPILHGLFPIPYYMGGVIHPPPAKSLEDAPNGLFFDDYVPRNIWKAWEGYFCLFFKNVEKFCIDIFLVKKCQNWKFLSYWHVMYLKWKLRTCTIHIQV